MKLKQRTNDNAPQQSRPRLDWSRAREWHDGNGLSEVDALIGEEKQTGPTCSGPPIHAEFYTEEPNVSSGVRPWEHPWYERMKPQASRDLARVREFALRVVIRGENINKAGAAVGWTSSKAAYVARRSEAYQRARADLLAEHELTLSGLTEEIKAIESDTAYTGAHRRNEIVHESKDEILAAKVAADALDRIGYKSATKIDQSIKVELDAASQQLLSKVFRELPKVAAIDLEKGPFGYALRQPRELLGSVSAAEAARQAVDGDAPELADSK